MTDSNPRPPTERHARGAADGHEAMVGDTVLIRGVVRQSVAGVGARIRFTSKTEHFEGWIREDDLRFVLSAAEELPTEPPDGTWRLVMVAGNSRIFHRSDAEGHNDRDARRHDRHWWDVVAEEWIDWPTAVLRGAGSADAQEMIVVKR